MLPPPTEQSASYMARASERSLGLGLGVEGIRRCHPHPQWPLSVLISTRIPNFLSYPRQKKGAVRTPSELRLKPGSTTEVLRPTADGDWLMYDSQSSPKSTYAHKLTLVTSIVLGDFLLTNLSLKYVGRLDSFRMNTLAKVLSSRARGVVS